MAPSTPPASSAESTTSMRRFRRITAGGGARSASDSGSTLGGGAEAFGNSGLSISMPLARSRDAVRALDPHDLALARAEAQLCGAEQPVHHVVRGAETVVHDLAVALPADDEQGRKLPLRNVRRELDVHALPV